jgi:hypothetical protein
LSHDVHFRKALPGKPAERCVDESLSPAFPLRARADGDQSDLTCGLIQTVARNIADRLSIKLGHQYGIGISVAASFDPGLVQGITPGSRKVAVIVKARVSVTCRGNGLQSWHILWREWPEDTFGGFFGSGNDV